MSELRDTHSYSQTPTSHSCRAGLLANSVQAPQLAFEAVRLELEPHAAVLTWYGEHGETGLPQYVPYMFGGRFRKRLEAMVDREIEREARRLEQRSKSQSQGIKRPIASGSRLTPAAGLNQSNTPLAAQRQDVDGH